MQYCCRRESPKGKYSLKNSKQDGKIRKLYLPNADCGVFGWEFGLGFLRRSVFATLGESSKLQTGNGSFCVAPPTWPMLQIGRLTLAPTPSNVLIAFTDYEI